MFLDYKISFCRHEKCKLPNSHSSVPARKKYNDTHISLLSVHSLRRSSTSESEWQQAEGLMPVFQNLSLKKTFDRQTRYDSMPRCESADTYLRSYAALSLVFCPKLRTTVDRQILARVGKGHNNQSYQLEQEFVYHFDCVWFTYDIFRVYSIV